MVTSVALGLVISFEPHEADVMRRAPRAVSRPILDGFAIWRVIFVGVALLVLTLAAFFWMKSTGASDALARSVAVNTLVIGQIFYLLNSRFKTESSLSLSAHLGNPYLPLGIAAVIVLQLLFTYAPPFQRLFGTEAIPLDIWPRLLAGGFVFFLIVEAEKWVIRRFGCRPASQRAEAARSPGRRRRPRLRVWPGNGRRCWARLRSPASSPASSTPSGAAAPNGATRRPPAAPRHRRVRAARGLRAGLRQGRADAL